MKWNYFRFGFAALIALPAGAALAADVAAPQQQVPANSVPIRPYDIVLEVGAGGWYGPAYEGAKKYKVSPTGFMVLNQLWVPGFGQVKDDRVKTGFTIGPSFRYMSKRESNDYAEIRGLNNVDATFELGGIAAYTFNIFRPWAAVRYGFGGHSGVVGEAGIDVIFRPTAMAEVSIGPRASFASSDYMRTYFGVTPAESTLSGLRTYTPNGGFKGAGALMRARYRLTPEWSLVGSLLYEKLIGDAADSPIVQAGASDQFTAKLGLSYTFGLKLFNN